MKYLSVLVFAVLLAWTWRMIHSEHSISFETHAGIQEKLAALIQQTVLNKKPGASEIAIEHIWTEPESAGKVLAHFAYSFQEPDTNGKSLTNRIEGQGLLERQADDGSGLDHWTLTQVKTTSDAVVFEDGLTVTPGDEPDPQSVIVAPKQDSDESDSNQ